MKFILFCATLDLSDNLTETCIVKNSIGPTKSVLRRMIVMKIRYFHGHTGILTEPMRHQNLYILW